jgi:nitroimidazol reductase NimA-like FMN-containing flavoprotein (pyridoxamine 5'-phosphate oxidase superfamily)
MLGTLNDTQIEKLLSSSFIGRIGTHAFGKTYILPVSYAYKDNCVYVHTYEGLKLSMMRQNPYVCFEVENLEEMANWQTVVAWGTFQEIIDEEERNEGLRILTNRPFSGAVSETVQLGNLWPFAPDDVSRIDGIVFRIQLSEKTGRFEHATPKQK